MKVIFYIAIVLNLYLFGLNLSIENYEFACLAALSALLLGVGVSYRI